MLHRIMMAQIVNMMHDVVQLAGGSSDAISAKIGSLARDIFTIRCFRVFSSALWLHGLIGTIAARY